MQLSKSGDQWLVRRLDEKEVLGAVIKQLQKDLGATEGTWDVPSGPHAFEALRELVLPLLEEKQRRSVHELQVAMYRVDLSEKVTLEAMRLGGLDELAGRVVLRSLQKVLTRLALG